MIINANNVDALKKFPDNHFDSIVTDPPYGLGKEPDAVEVMNAWATTGYHEIKGTGFMGKEWDAFVPQPLFWKEVFRVLKPGGHCLAFYGTRTYDWGVMAMRFAGFEVRDCIQWLYGSGFPKSHNIGKAIGNTALEGWGSALKPANEPIVLARKPLEKGLSIAENVLKWGTGGINIDGCRVSTEENLGRQQYAKTSALKCSNYEDKFFEGNPSGRFPANIILTHHPECECKGTKKVKAIKGGCKFKSAFFKSGESNFTKDGGIGDVDGNETIEDWNCHPDCPIKLLDEQSGTLNKQGVSKTDNKSGWQNKYVGGDKVNPIERKLYLDTGGASRFFYVAKASKSERNKGLDEFEKKQTFTTETKGKRYVDDVNCADGKYQAAKAPNQNFHPTVKPVKLMQYLVRLVTPPNGIVLDPFCGSGTTGIACKLEGFEFIGIEQDAEYCKIAEARIKSTVIDIKLF